MSGNVRALGDLARHSILRVPVVPGYVAPGRQGLAVPVGGQGDADGFPRKAATAPPEDGQTCCSKVVGSSQATPAETAKAAQQREKR